MPKKVTPGSITQTADAQKNRINNISNVSRAISQMQKDVDQKIAETQKEVKESKSISQVHESMNTTLSRLNQTIGALTTGVAKITTDTARATSDVVRQYGKAISQDVSLNKKSVVAMALSQTSPLYGYFVAKFMETDVFKRALNRMKLSISQTIGAIVRPLKGPGGAKGGAQIPHMQTGGKVQQGGMARLHAGETVVPQGVDLSGVDSTLKEILHVQKRQSLYMRSVFGVWGEMKLGQKILNAISPFSAPFKILRMFRKTKSAYASHLSKSSMPLENIAQNVATLYKGLMWRLDNMMNIMVANVEATRDLAAYVTKQKYAPIRGVPSRVPAFAAARFIAKALTKPISGPLSWMMEPLFGGKTKKALYKRRGLYKDEPGLASNIWNAIRPRGRKERLGLPGDRGKIARGGEYTGPEEGIGAGLSPEKMKELAREFSETLGGRIGRSQPVWTITQYTPEQASSLANRQAFLEAIKDSNEAQENMQEKAQKEAKKGGWIKRIIGWAGMILPFIMTLIKGLGLSAMAAGIGYAIGKWLDKKFGISEKIQEFFALQKDLTAGIMAVAGKEAKMSVDYMGKLRRGEISPEVAFTQVQRSKRLNFAKNKAAIEKRVEWSTMDAADLQAGMNLYVQSHMADYLKYDGNKISALRNEFLNGSEGGGWLAKQWQKVKGMANANEVGKELEARFHAYFMKKLTPLTVEQQQAPESYKKAWMEGAKKRGLTPEQIAAERKKQKEQAGRMRRDASGISSVSGKDPEKIKAAVRKSVQERLAKILAGDAGETENWKGYLGLASNLYDKIIDGLPPDHPLLKDETALMKIAREAAIAHEGAKTWYGGYDPSKVDKLVREKVAQYKAKPPKPGSPETKESIQGAMPSAAVAADQVELAAAEVRIGSTALSESIDNMGKDIKETNNRNTGALIQANNQNFMNSNNTSSTVGGGAGMTSLDSGDDYVRQGKGGGRN
jgi:uncharacterized protein with PIN domain